MCSIIRRSRSAAVIKSVDTGIVFAILSLLTVLDPESALQVGSAMVWVISFAIAVFTHMEMHPVAQRGYNLKSITYEEGIPILRFDLKRGPIAGFVSGFRFGIRGWRALVLY